jgi:hypothetical protein
VTTSTVSYTDSAATLEWADTYADRTLHSNIAEKALEYGLATRSELEAIAASWHAWGQDPDALWCFSHTEMVAQNDSVKWWKTVAQTFMRSGSVLPDSARACAALPRWFLTQICAG